MFLLSERAENGFIDYQHETCYNSIYPYGIFPRKGLSKIEFAPITILYGGNGSGKTTLLNIVAETSGIKRYSAFNSSAFFEEYLKMCRVEGRGAPIGSKILTSDDVFDYLLNIRYLNEGIDIRREELFEDYYRYNKDPVFFRTKLSSLDEYDDWKENWSAKLKNRSTFVNDRLMKNTDMFSNGESAIRFFTEYIERNAVYLLDEPENSLDIIHQKKLADFILQSARFDNCQFIISTHSPVLLSIKNALIYDLDSTPVRAKKWTELENVRQYFKFFEQHREEFL